MSDLKLASEFPALGRDDWMKRVEAVLKGASFEEKLVHSSADGIRLEPLYGQLPGPRAARAAQVPWTLHQRIDHPDAARANELALDDLTNGATGLVLVTKDGATIITLSMSSLTAGTPLAPVSISEDTSATANEWKFIYTKVAGAGLTDFSMRLFFSAAHVANS